MVWCGAVRFVQFSYYKTANYTTPCGVVRCGALLLAVRCGAVRLWHFVGGFGAVCAVYTVW